MAHGKTLEEENHHPNANVYCFQEAAHKLFVQVSPEQRQ
jgi:hypothetical protein